MKKFNTFLYEKTASLDVDCQKGFSPLCPDELPVPGGDLIVDALNKQAQFGKLRACSVDWHPADALWLATEDKPQFTPITDHPDLDMHWKAHCIVGTEGAQLLPGLPIQDYNYIVYKGTRPNMHPYGACYHDLSDTRTTGLIEFFKMSGIEHVIVGGLAFDYCVKTTAIQLSKHFKVTINLDATRSIGDPKVAVTELIAAGVVFVNLTPEENRFD
jgi:nicotinamidase/pyrazinamidase